ncbi:S-cell enriched with leucine-rich repeat-containing protein slrA-like [Prunus avium]|uniref:S-cell enriched with leucine-rich repeat-containing protein slrA-like n=1 Tax=Prunus avium TaxID=42229 RepID=A0A6P5TJK5_PRUAV|nr:S-cell enriched with leucine-rich repeat-containing protein slrA-like [Prunus avium]
MIKRRFYKLEHGDRDGPSNSSSSSSDSEIEPEAVEDSDDDDVVEELEEDAQACSTSSGYQSEGSSANEVPGDSSGRDCLKANNSL